MSLERSFAADSRTPESAPPRPPRNAFANAAASGSWATMASSKAPVFAPPFALPFALPLGGWVSPVDGSGRFPCPSPEPGVRGRRTSGRGRFKGYPTKTVQGHFRPLMGLVGVYRLGLMNIVDKPSGGHAGRYAY